eukprot:scaffold209661_cov16-Prasinocladus_malaysianus.AAC.1
MDRERQISDAKSENWKLFTIPTLNQKYQQEKKAADAMDAIISKDRPDFVLVRGNCRSQGEQLIFGHFCLSQSQTMGTCLSPPRMHILQGWFPDA